MTQAVAKRSDASKAMLDAAANQRALMGGTRAMRAAGNTYLPKFKAEEQEDYEARLKSSWLFNGYRKTVRDMAGRVFDKPVEIVDVKAPVGDWTANIDMAGRDLSQFAREVFLDGLQAGISFIMVDAPRREGSVSQLQAQAQNLRPYFVHLRIEDILGWKTVTEGNTTSLSMLRIKETVEIDDPADEFDSDKLVRIRVLTVEGGRVRVRIYEEIGGNYVLDADNDYYTDAEEITVVPFYANRSGFFTGEPVLDDLADVNIAHWQSQSDQRNILHKARVPILHITGRDEDEALVVSASSAVQSRDPAAKMEWVEHSGGAIGAGRTDLKDLEFQMEALGLQLLVSSAQTATGEARASAKETSQLAAIADNLKDALEEALRMAADYAAVDQEIVVRVNKEFGVTMLTAQDVLAMLAAVNTGQLSRETFLSELKGRGFISPDINTLDEIDRIQEEGGTGLDAE